jgi:hypothetical protein
MSIREKVGRIIPQSELEELPSTIDELLSGDQLFTNQIESLREEFVYNLGDSESVGLEEIKKLLKTLKN